MKKYILILLLTSYTSANMAVNYMSQLPDDWPIKKKYNEVYKDWWSYLKHWNFVYGCEYLNLVFDNTNGKYRNMFAKKFRGQKNIQNEDHLSLTFTFFIPLKLELTQKVTKALNTMGYPEESTTIVDDMFKKTTESVEKYMRERIAELEKNQLVGLGVKNTALV